MTKKAISAKIAVFATLFTSILAGTGCEGRYSPNCLRCITGTSICVECGPNFIAEQETCLPHPSSECPINYCEKCTSPTNCIRCAPGSFLLNAKKCLACTIRMCEVCLTQTRCAKCISGHSKSDDSSRCEKDHR